MQTRFSACRKCRILLIAWSLAGLFLFFGCASPVRTPYNPPEVKIPTAWEHQPTATAPAANRWWERFGDPTLNRLVDEVLTRNNDLAAATILVRKAHLQAERADSARLPGLTVTGSGGISRSLGSGSTETRSFSLAADVGYELDLWGKLAADSDAAHWEALATEEDKESTALALIGATASLYWQIGALNQRLRLAEESIASARRTLELTWAKQAAGAASTLDVLETERALATQEASRTPLVQQRVEARNALAILLNGPPQDLKLEEPQDILPAILPPVMAGLPADLLARRPDLRAAEARLRSVLATADSTKAGFYPGITLTGRMSGASAELSRLLKNPVGALTVDLTLPFVQWRDMQRTIEISKADYQRAAVNFRQTLYAALADVENSLSALEQYRLQAEKQESTLLAAKRTEELYRIRYQAGGSPLQSLLDAQENRRLAEIDCIENRLNRLLGSITLFKALGGDMPQVTAQAI